MVVRLKASEEMGQCQELCMEFRKTQDIQFFFCFFSLDFQQAQSSFWIFCYYVFQSCISMPPAIRLLLSNGGHRIFDMHNDLSTLSALQKIAPYWLGQNSTAKLKVAACSFSYFAARSWNSLPSNIRHVCKNPRHIQYPNLSPTFSLSTSQINNPNNFLRMIFL